MGKKGALTSIFSRLVVVDSPAAAVDSASPPPWPWPSCRNPQTTSFRADDDPCTKAAGGTRCGSPAAARLRRATSEMYKTVNSVYFDSADESCFDDDEEEDVLDDDRFSTMTSSEERSEAVIRSLGRTTSTDRFFFDPGPPTNSILAAASALPARTPPAEAKAKLTVSNDNDEKLLEPYSSKSLVEESVAVAVDSEDPYRDFRASMEEMVAAHGLRGWEALEELLVWYLRVNAKHNHALIVGAFVDLLVGLATTSPSTAATTTTTTATTSISSSSSASTSSSTSTSTTSDGGGVTRRTTTTAAAMERCGGGNEASASCSSSSCVTCTSDQDEAGEKASDHTRN